MLFSRIADPASELRRKERRGAAEVERTEDMQVQGGRSIPPVSRVVASGADGHSASAIVLPANLVLLVLLITTLLGVSALQ